MDSTLDYDLVKLVRREARQIAQATGCNLQEAYREAVAAVFMSIGEGDELDPFEAGIVASLRRLNRKFGGPVKIVTLESATGLSTTKLWEMLENLENRRQVRRPKGDRGGWEAVR